MKTSGITVFARKLAALVVVLCMMCMVPAAAFAAETNEAVRNDTTGVVQVKLVYVDPNNQNESSIQSGTGFLINDSTVITCNHVVAIDAETMATAVATFGVDENTIKNNSVIKISVLRDMTIEATIKNYSAEMDYAILNLSSQLYDRTYLPIRSSATVQQTEEAYSLGFPGEVKFFQDVNTYTSDDVTIASGRVNKINTIGGVDYIQTSTQFTSGNSGGPLVDANGAVIGICQGHTGEGFDKDYYYAIAIDQLTKSLDSLGIDYTTADATGTVAAETEEPADSAETTAPAEETAPAVDKSGLSALVTDMQDIEAKDYTEETGSAFSAALSDAQSVLANEEATQEQVDAAQTALNDAFGALEPASNNMLFIIIGIVAAVVIIVVIIIVVVVSKKKKPAKDTQSYSYEPPVRPQGNNAPVNNGGFAPVKPVTPATTPAHYPMGSGAGETSVLNQGAGETTVLNQGSSETTVLNQNVHYGTLTRKKNKENIKINSARFIIGKERAKVNYCVVDNTSVSRTHATIVNRGGTAYLMDMNATNGTFVNGVRLNPGQETALKNGDTILLADEEFTYYV